MTHNMISSTADRYLIVPGPPNSPPTNTLLRIITMKQTTATIRNTKTENPRSPAGTS